MFNGFIEGQVLFKLTGCENDFTHLAWLSRGSFFLLQKVQFKTFCPHVKTSCPPAKNVNETPAKCL